MKGPVKISIITVVFNSKADLIKTMESVLSQTFNNIEHIIIDGGSTDGTVDIIRQNVNHIAKWISEPDKGIYDAMNKGIRMATGDYIGFLNAGDCYFNENTIRDMFACLSDNNPHLVYGDSISTDRENSKPRLQKALEFNLKNLLKHTTRVVCHQAIFVRKDIIPQYDTRWKLKAELNWYFDLAEQVPDLEYCKLDLPVVYFDTMGTGHYKFWSNLKELLTLVRERYGWMTLVRYNYIVLVYLKIAYRYRWLRPFS
jgi:glycosyltransferase involved in cell wall biosynthesis